MTPKRTPARFGLQATPCRPAVFRAGEGVYPSMHQQQEHLHQRRVGEKGGGGGGGLLMACSFTADLFFMLLTFPLMSVSLQGLCITLVCIQMKKKKKRRKNICLLFFCVCFQSTDSCLPFLFKKKFNCAPFLSCLAWSRRSIPTLSFVFAVRCVRNPQSFHTIHETYPHRCKYAEHKTF